MSLSLPSRRTRVAAAVLASAGILLTGCGNSSDSADKPSSATSSSKSTSAPTTAPTSESTPTPSKGPTGGTQTVPAEQGKAVLGPDGFGKLKLGMTQKQAEATGMLKAKTNPDGGACRGYDVRGYPTGENSVGVYVSKKYGLVAIFAQRGMKTPEGARLGNTLAELRKAFPGLDKETNGYSAPARGNDDASYTILVNGKGVVYELGLASRNQDCFG